MLDGVIFLILSVVILYILAIRPGYKQPVGRLILASSALAGSIYCFYLLYPGIILIVFTGLFLLGDIIHCASQDTWGTTDKHAIALISTLVNYARGLPIEKWSIVTETCFEATTRKGVSIRFQKSVFTTSCSYSLEFEGKHVAGYTQYPVFRTEQSNHGCKPVCSTYKHLETSLSGKIKEHKAHQNLLLQERRRKALIAEEKRKSELHRDILDKL